MRRDDHDGARRFAHDVAECFQPAQLGQLEIERNDIWIQLMHQPNCFVAVCGRADHATCLAVVDAVALHEGGHRRVARVVRATAAEHVVEHAFAHRRLAHRHALEAQRVERMAVSMS